MNIWRNWTITLHLLWYDFWVGVFFDQQKKIVYIGVFPMVILKIKKKESPPDWIKDLERVDQEGRKFIELYGIRFYNTEEKDENPKQPFRNN